MAGPDETVLVIVPEHVVYRPYYSRVSRGSTFPVHLPASGPPRPAVAYLPLRDEPRVWALWSFHRWGEAQDAVVGTLEDAGLPVTGSWSFRRLRITRHERVPGLGTGRQPVRPAADSGG